MIILIKNHKGIQSIILFNGNCIIHTSAQIHKTTLFSGGRQKPCIVLVQEKKWLFQLFNS